MATRNSPDGHEPPPVLTTEEARQGRTKNTTRWVLGVGLLLACLAMLIVYLAVF